MEPEGSLPRSQEAGAKRYVIDILVVKYHKKRPIGKVGVTLKYSSFAKQPVRIYSQT
jgi:hypothetical protein